MTEIDSFTEWVKKFAVIYDWHIKEFLDLLDNDLDLHQMKSLFANKYQNRIEFSYILHVEKGCVKNLHMQGINDYSYGFGYGYGFGFGFGVYGKGDSDGDGFGISNDIQHEYSYFSGAGVGFGNNYGEASIAGFGDSSDLDI